MYLLPSLPLSRSVRVRHVSGISLQPPPPTAALLCRWLSSPLSLLALSAGSGASSGDPPLPTLEPPNLWPQTKAQAGPLVSAPGQVGETQGGAGGVEALEREGQSPSREGGGGRRTARRQSCRHPLPSQPCLLSPTPAMAPEALCPPGCPPPCPQHVHPGKGLVQAPQWALGGLGACGWAEASGARQAPGHHGPRPAHP